MVAGWDKLVHVYPVDENNLLPIGLGSSRRIIGELTTVGTDQNGKLATRPPPWSQYVTTAAPPPRHCR